MIRKIVLATLVPAVIVAIIALIVLSNEGSNASNQVLLSLGPKKYKPTVRTELQRVYASAGMIQLAKRRLPYETPAELAQMITRDGLQKSWVVESHRFYFADGTSKNAYVIVHPGMVFYRFDRDQSLMSILAAPTGESTEETEVVTIPRELETKSPEEALKTLVEDE